MAIGVDEAGRGPVLGPLVVAAASCEDIEVLRETGVKDSKLLTAGKREIIRERLIGSFPVGMVKVPADMVDEARESMTMNRLEVLAFSSTLATVLTGKPLLHPDLPGGVTASISGSGRGSGRIKLDAADVDEDRFGREVGDCLQSIIDVAIPRIVSRHKADRDDPVVGVASVFAKVERDREIERIKTELGREVGSGYPSDVRTRRFIGDWVRENGDLPPYTRRSWETARKILADNLQPTLFSFE